MFHVKQDGYDVVVIGGGHAGVEAAHAAARCGASVALVTLRRDTIGVMSCNPAIGGLGKGHLVREIDALDGLMGRVADKAGIQFRLLNRRKGPAVQGPRAQADRKLYLTGMQAEISASRIDVIEGEVIDIAERRGRVAGVELGDGTTIACRSCVLTAGTFLRGVIHVGQETRTGGRMGEGAAERLSSRLLGLGVTLGRLKTGTPPRLDGRTIAWSELERQPGDETPTLFSFLSSRVSARQVACSITHTNAQTHEIIRRNLESSAMYGGRIAGTGPRYCPSIEDKVVRFAEKDSHQIFLEPEGLDTTSVYPNGISTSLPLQVQQEYVRSIKGLTAAEIIQPGYAIEYDYVDPRSLTPGLALKSLPGLYLAGQINGTTGYEEAAAQGLVAGLNAVCCAREQDEIRFSRTTSYIGVMIDDLVTRGVTEPYRMFTSRAEFRLTLRADNADQRLTPLGIALGCIGTARRTCFELKMDELYRGRAELEAISVTPKELAAIGLKVSQDGRKRNGLDVLSLDEGGVVALRSLGFPLSHVSEATLAQLSIDAIYRNYAERQSRDAAALQRDERTQIPVGFDFGKVGGLSEELRDKLSRAQPVTLAQAARIEGMTPAALTAILAHLRRQERTVA